MSSIGDSTNSDSGSSNNDKIRDHIPPPPGPLFAYYSVGTAALVYIAHTIYVWIYCGC